MWKKLKAKLKGEDEAPTTADPSESGYDNLNAGIPYPDQAARVDEGGVFRSRPQSSKLGIMRVALEVYRQGHANSTDIEMPLSQITAFIKRGLEDFTHMARSYSWDQFQSTFQRRLDENTGAKPTTLRYGRIGYFTSKGEHKEVHNQKDFEKALINLYENRGDENLLKFILQPEAQDKRDARVAAEKEVADKLAAEKKAEEEKKAAKAKKAANLAKDFERTGESSEQNVRPITPGISGKIQHLFDRNPPTPDPTPERAGEWPLSKIVTEPTPSTQRPDRFSTRIVQESRIPRPATSEGRQQYIPSSSQGSQGKESSSSGKSSPVLAIGKAIKKAVTPSAKRTPETDEERRVRLQGLKLFEEEGRKNFKKGGDEKSTIKSIEQTSEEAEELKELEAIEEAELEEDISQEDRVAAQLQKLLELEELTQLNGPKDKEGTFPRWEECCRMFGHDPKDTDINSNITLAGLKTRIYQYQAYSIYWQMLTSRNLGGGFVADDVGLGKTLSYLAYIVAERQLAVLWREVEKSRKALDGKHLLLIHTPGRTCPQPGKPGWITCPCSSSSPTAKMAPQLGVRMVCVPPPLVQNWWGQWKDHVDTLNNDLGMRIVVDHAGAFTNTTSMADQKSSSSVLPTQTRLIANLARKDAQADDTPKDHSEGYLLLTTKESFAKLEKIFEYKGQIHDSKKPGEWKSGTRNSLIIGIAAIDESHEEYFKNKGRAAVLTNLPTSNTTVVPFLWGYSGTPISQTPRGLEGVLYAIEENSNTNWAEDPKFQQFEWAQLDAICKRYDAQLKSSKRDNAALERILADFKPFLTNFVIRRTSSTNWFGHPLMKLKPHYHQDVRLKQNAAITDDIPAFEALFDADRAATLAIVQANWDNFPNARRTDIRPTELGFNTMVSETWRSRLLATFPGLCKLARSKTDANRLSLTENEVIGFLRETEPKQNTTPYGRFLKDIVETSPKCMWLYEFITVLNTQTDLAGKPEKLVILSAFPQAAFILKLFVQKYFPEEKSRVGVITQRMKATERSQIIDCFIEAKDAKGNPKSKREIRFLIGTTLALGKGLGLTQACNVVLMEPDSFTVESQAYGRVNRIGQKNPISRSYRLITVGSEIEGKILKRQVDRKEVYGRPIVDEELERIESIGLGIST